MPDLAAFSSANSSFVSLFQVGIQADDTIEFSIEELLTACAASSIAQYPLNQTKVQSIVKSIVKEGILYIKPEIASYNGVDYLVGGRHRCAAADYITKHYGIDAKGKVVLITEANRDSLVLIERRMQVRSCVVDSMKHLSGLILASNGSRTMTGPESAAVKSMGGMATAGDKFKLRFSPFLDANLDLTDLDGNPITVSPVTLAQIASKCSAKIKGLANASDIQLDTLASNLNEYLTDECSLPTTFAQHYAPFVAEFLGHTVEIEDEDGEVIETYDTEGELIEVSYASHFMTLLPTVEKKAKAPKKASVDMAKFEAMAAKLAALGIDPNAV